MNYIQMFVEKKKKITQFDRSSIKAPHSRQYFEANCVDAQRMSSVAKAKIIQLVLPQKLL